MNDPVCGMTVGGNAKLRADFQGQRFLFCSKRCLSEFQADPTKFVAPSAASATVTDVVCGMTVRDDSPHRAKHQGQIFYFCCAHCQAKFEADPAAYVQSGKANISNQPGPG